MFIEKYISRLANKYKVNSLQCACKPFTQILHIKISKDIYTYIDVTCTTSKLYRYKASHGQIYSNRRV